MWADVHKPREKQVRVEATRQTYRKIQKDSTNVTSVQVK